MTRARKLRMAALATAVAVAVALSVVGLVVASASQLNVSGGSLFLQNASRCTNATIATTGFATGGGATWNRVRLVGVPAACVGLPVSVVVYRSNGNSLATGTGTAALGTVEVAVAATGYDSTHVTGVALLIGGWGVPTTWSAGGISLRSFQTGGYVTAADTTSSLIANSSTTIGNHQQFDLITNADGSVSLRAHGANDHYVTVSGTKSQLYANSDGNGGTPQRFYLISNPDGTIALQSLANNMYVCADFLIATPPPLAANRTQILQWEEFYLVID